VLFLELVAQRLLIVAAVTLPHQYGRNVVGNGAIVNPAQRGHRVLDEPKGSNPSAYAAWFRITQLCHVVSVSAPSVMRKERPSRLFRTPNGDFAIMSSMYARLYAMAQSAVS
jgi:hypothetical protein